jgi:hypothetical protein
MSIHNHEGSGEQLVAHLKRYVGGGDTSGLRKVVVSASLIRVRLSGEYTSYLKGRKFSSMSSTFFPDLYLKVTTEWKQGCQDSIEGNSTRSSLTKLRLLIRIYSQRTHL